MLLLTSPTFFPDPKENITPFRYVLEKGTYFYTVRRQNWWKGKWEATVFFGSPFEKGRLEEAILCWQKRIDSTIQSWKACEYDKAFVAYRDPNSEGK